MLLQNISKENKKDYLLITLLREMEPRLKGILDDSTEPISSISVVFVNGYTLKIISGPGTLSDSLSFEVDVPPGPYILFTGDSVAYSTKSGKLSYQTHDQVVGLAIEISLLPELVDLYNPGLSH